jgi:hypothetical protein
VVRRLLADTAGARCSDLFLRSNELTRSSSKNQEVAGGSRHANDEPQLLPPCFMPISLMTRSRLGDLSVAGG